MAITISELPAGSSPVGTEIAPFVQGGQTVALSINQMLSLGLTIAQVKAAINQAYIGQTLYAENAFETAVGATPVNTLYPWYTILRYYSGSGDATPALQKACNASAQADFGMVTAGQSGLLLPISSAWTIDTNKTGVDFQGAFLNAKLFAPGSFAAWCTPIQSSTDPNARPALNAAHPIKGFTVQGPGVQNANACMLYLNDTNPVGGTDYDISGVIVRCSSLDFGQDVIFANGAFCCQIDLVAGQTSFSAGSATTYSVSQQSSINSGERNVLKKYWSYNKAYGVQNLNGAADLMIEKASIDGAVRAISVNDSTVTVDVLHLESTADSDYYLNCTGTNGKLLIEKLLVVLDAAKNSFAIGNCDSSVTWGGIDIETVTLNAAAGYGNIPLIDGTGNVRVGKVYGLGTAAGQPSYISLPQNLLADPIFASNGFAADGWTAAGSGTPPVVEGTAPYAGSKDVKFVGAGGGLTSILTSRVFPCVPGQSASVQVQAQLPTFNAGAAFTCKASYVNAQGNALVSVIGGTTGAGFTFMNITATQAAYAPASTAGSGGLGRAPPGTVGFVLSFNLGGATSVGYLGRVIVGVN